MDITSDFGQTKALQMMESGDVIVRVSMTDTGICLEVHTGQEYKFHLTKRNALDLAFSLLKAAIISE